MTQALTVVEDTFPFAIEDIDYWVIKRKDGTFTKYILISNVTQSGAGSVTYSNKPAASYHYTDYCNHDPAALPVFEKDGVQLFIADAPGARKTFKEFDYVIDGGDAITLFSAGYQKSLLEGDSELTAALAKWETTDTNPGESAARLLKIDWYDRRAPKVKPGFWPDYLAQVGKGRILTVCQGGHGRSGTALVALMMCLTDYTPLDAITHLRAVHCPRAIESVDQHEYLNQLAVFLGRDPNALEAQKVKSFKERFLSLSNPIAKPYQDRIEATV